VQKGNQITCGTGVLSESIGAGDILEFRGHGHEPPIPYFGDKFDIIHEDDEVLVINKPAGLPSHPSGKYQKNSATEILRQQRGEPFYRT
jgi:tRNA pseudouridine synthase 9